MRHLLLTYERREPRTACGAESDDVVEAEDLDGDPRYRVTCPECLQSQEMSEEQPCD